MLPQARMMKENLSELTSQLSSSEQMLRVPMVTIRN